jgi:hypothetical protein
VDFVTRAYVLDDDGNPAQMPSTRQRVLFALDNGDPAPKFLTDLALNRRKAQIEANLKPMVDEGAIRLDRVLVENNAQGSGREQIDYTDLATGIDDTVTRSG